MNLSELARRFHFLSNLEVLPEAERQILQRVLAEELHRREQKRLAYLMKCSGIKRVKLLTDFDWTFNPKLPREKFLQFVGTRWLTEPANLLLIGQAGVGKTHLATALCHDALTKGFQTLFLTLFELTAKIAKARNPYNLIEFYSRVPVLCIDELGYVIPTREQADALFQVISRRVEVNSTIVTTNLIPSQWGKIFDATTASAILDRLSHNGTFLTLEGRSYRSRK
jgi:DNA replication protein DnaC